MVGGGATRSLPRDQRSKMVEAVTKMARRRGSDAGQSGRRWVRSCRECPQALHEEFSFRFILHRLRGQEKAVTVAAKSGQFTAGDTGKREFSKRGSCEKDSVSKKSSACA